jgi:uncharacterized protein (TIRG00374 family)
MKKRVVSYLLLAFFLILFGLYYSKNRDDFTILGDISATYLLIAVLSHFLIVCLNGLLIKLLVKPFGKELGGFQSLYASMISSAGNFFLPAGSGMALRAVYLKRTIKLRYKTFISTLYGNYIIVFFTSGVFGLISVVVLSGGASVAASFVLGGIFVTMVVASAYLALVGTPKVITQVLNRAHAGRFSRAASEIVRGWDLVVTHRGLVIKMIALALAGLLVSVVVYYSAVSALGLTVGVWQLVLYSTMGTITMFINLTPGAIGIRELLFIYAGSLLGFSASEIIAISLIERGAKFIVLAVGWPLLYLIAEHSSTSEHGAVDA